MEQTRIVVTLVKVFKNTRKDFRLFVREIDAFAVRLHELTTAAGSKKWRNAEDIFMSCKQPLFGANTDGNYSGSESTTETVRPEVI